MKLLVVVDYQNDFVDGSLGFEGSNDIEKHIIEEILKFKNNRDDIVYTLDTHESDYLSTEEGKNLPIKHCLINSHGHEIYGEVKKHLKDFQGFNKYTFGSKELGLFLEDKNYEEIVLLGLVSNMCVLANAIVAKTFSPNSHIVIDALGSASFDKELEAKAYDVAQGLQIEVRGIK